MTKPNSYRLSNAASRDLNNIRKHGRKTFGRAHSEAHIAKLKHVLQIIADNPELGRLYPEFCPPARIHPHGPHIVMYTLDDERTPVIQRILNALEAWQEKANSEDISDTA